MLSEWSPLLCHVQIKARLQAAPVVGGPLRDAMCSVAILALKACRSTFSASCKAHNFDFSYLKETRDHFACLF